jgi:exosortase A-associated hydrolase 1
MTYHEQASVFECEGDRLIGIAAQPPQPAATGVVIIVGGPQYRAGSHRQFTLLARQLAEHGIASFRFDYRGMGDSEGAMRNFEAIDADIKAAIDTFMAHVPAIRQVVLWGLCDAASAALYYGHTDPRVKSMILLNPWVHTEAGAARARLKHYYLARLLSRAFWAKLLSGKVRIGASLGDVAHSARHAGAPGNNTAATSLPDPRHGSPGYIDRMLKGLKLFKGKAQLILSGNDLTAQEFKAIASTDKGWKKAVSDRMPPPHEIKGATHTFSSRVWRNEIERITRDLTIEVNNDFPG